MIPPSLFTNLKKGKMTKEELITEVGAYHKPLQASLKDMAIEQLLRLCHPLNREANVRALFKEGVIDRDVAKKFIKVQEY